VQAVENLGGGRYTTTFRGHRYDIETEEELAQVERTISDVGYYPWRAEPGELDHRIEEGTVDDLLLELMRQRLERWMEMADERLRPQGKQVFWMLGNDDPPSLAEPLQNAPWGQHAEGHVLPLDDEHTLISWGYSNPTPWNSFREMSEDELTGHFEQLFAQAPDEHRVVFNAHVPPYDTGLDDAPMLDANLTVTQQAGQVKLGPVGSTAVRGAIERHQPIASIHGHVHESAGFRRIGRTMAVNPGSDYGTGSLNGALLTLSGDKLKAHQLVRG
jgi:Icc-related predicted phosphoesterase